MSYSTTLSSPVVVGFDIFSTSNEGTLDPAVNQWLQENFPDLVPSVPVLSERRVEVGVSNPFALEQVILHPRMKSRPTRSVKRTEGVVSGLIKFHYKMKQNTAGTGQNANSREDKPPSEEQQNPFLKSCPNLPKDFGRGMKLSATDASLLKFCTSHKAFA